MRKLIILSISVWLISVAAIAQNPDDLLNLLTKKGTITKSEADSLKQLYSAKQDSAPLTLGRNLKLSGYTQVYYQNYEQPGKTDGFNVRKVRLDLQGNFSPVWDYRVLVDFVGASGATGTAATGGALIAPTLLDGFITYKPYSFFKITAGQFLIPFSIESLTADRNLETIDRSQVVSALAARKGDASNGLVDSIGNQNGRDIGVQVSGSLFKIHHRYLLDYYVAVINGAGINTLDNNQSKDLATRFVLHPFSFLDLGTSYYNGFDKFTSSTTKSQERVRLGFEATAQLNDFAFKSELIKGWDGNKNPIEHEGWYVQASYFLLHNRLQGVFRYDVYDPNTAKSARLETSTYYVYGLNYFFNKWTKFQVDYSRRTGTPNIGVNVFNAQLQLAF